jgi:thiamine-phosphate diphosphorylase
VTADIDLYIFAERYVFDSDSAWLNAICALIEMDVPGLAVQVRTKSEPEHRGYALASEARSITLDSRVPVLHNGTTAEAMALGYSGVHWPENIVPSKPETGPRLLRGASVHSLEATRRAEAAAADFIVAGTIYDAGSKPVPGEGIDKLRAIAGSTALPVLAIGGITPQRVRECIEAGAAGVATISYVLKAPDIEAAVRDMREALDEAEAS